MSNYYGGEPMSTQMKAGLTVGSWLLWTVVWYLILAAWAAGAGSSASDAFKWPMNFSKKYSAFTSHMSDQLINVGTTYDAAGLAARQNQIASNAGHSGMSNRNTVPWGHKQNLVGSYDRPVAWVPGMSNGMPDNWLAANGAAPQAATASATAVSGMTSSALSGSAQLDQALNSK